MCLRVLVSEHLREVNLVDAAAGENSSGQICMLVWQEEAKEGS